MDRKLFLTALLIAIMVSILPFVSSHQLGFVKASTIENGIISSDTTWTKAGSPYALTGPIGIAEGATLTIDPGVTVNIGTFYFEINGTLSAQGTSSEQIFFYSNNQYAGPPPNYNILDDAPENILMEYDNPTCTFENAVLNQTTINGDSYVSNATVTLIGCSLNSDSEIYVGGSATIQNCYVTGAVLLRGASTVTGSTFLGGVNVAGGAYLPPKIGSYLVSDNNITNTNQQQGNDALTAGDSGTITGNVIWGGSYAGISLDENNEYPAGSTIIEKNLIVNNQWGILVGGGDDSETIQDNTIAYNQVGIKSPTSSEIITSNNIQNNTQYNLYAGSESVTVANNWWGTTDQSTISDSIYDSKNDFNLGTVNFVPFLATPNPAAPAVTTPIPTLSPTSTPSSTLTTVTSPAGFNSIEIGIFATLIIIAALLFVTVALLLRKKPQINH